MGRPIGQRLVAGAVLVAVAACTAGSGPLTGPVARPFAPPAFDDRTVVLFDGSSWDGWVQRDASPSQWVVHDDGSVQATGGDAITTLEFQDCQLHVEFLCPLMEGKSGQARANSGVYLHGLYEVQVLDSYGLAPAINGCGAVYSVAPPLVNACRPPGTWQSYDIIFRGPRYDEADALVAPPEITVLHNGIAVQSHVEVPGPTPASLDRPMKPMGPLMLQFHGDPVRYRNIWLRRLN
jgi:hypothetical protein